MDQALLLVIVMLIISLGVITTIIYWTENGHYHPKTRKGITGYLPSLLITTQRQKHSDYPVPEAKIELIVDIQKTTFGIFVGCYF